MFNPKYRITNKMAQQLMEIQRANTIVEYLPLPSSIFEVLQKEAREQTVILSTKLEGNLLEEGRKRAALYSKKEQIEEVEEQEVFNLGKAIDFLDDCTDRNVPITEEFIKHLHAIIRIIHSGRRSKYSEYRTEQNQVGKKNEDGFYLPPEASDVIELMQDLVTWINSKTTQEVPAPIKAGIVMWEFLTIHPYMDGNGRTARMLATYILKRAGLSLKGLFVLENFYNRNLKEYYKNLQMNLHHNYYFGRHDCDITQWLEYFISGLAEVFVTAAKVVEEKSLEYTRIEPELIRCLDADQRIVFSMLAFQYNWISTSDLRKCLSHLSDRTIRDRIKKWINQGFIQPRDTHKERIRSYVLSPKYKKLAIEVSKEPDKYSYLQK